ncbi:hypothetical protein [Segetibacter sp.]|jgi:hypothetical protein|uniref:hypothetical protein n=1 Tax=Segetibacter sp. TaxID=2231182 RepID=UPI0026326707|nr:hypothetical protein [Segetibacter sp.]MCW3079062.1 hypothetical protein [Segetibacter sp.]
MPLSNDNQDYGQSDEKNKQNNTLRKADEDKLTTDDLKGKKVDRDPGSEEEEPSEQEK